ncbi:DUF4845 domain-containing protein [Tahibacter amnicola]|uniref:DUF4845 domain-containing protein n=1 Tax=Tahibacter amnicola TaxID=2976241 RepID=A0ABY6BI23_9GAMM|nr:DUF4845 domain-containing protein [Tahibacter amnicola]UXI69663.1 DUF4845 domain-containing protein [Tahibacter amnicola]
MTRKQRGITLIGFAIILAIVGFFAFIAMKLVPVYSEYMGVVKSMNLVRNEANIGQKSIEEIRQSLSIKMDSQYVDSKTIPPQQIQLKKQGGSASLRIYYDRRVDFIYNVDLLVSFDKTVDLTGPSL